MCLVASSLFSMANFLLLHKYPIFVLLFWWCLFSILFYKPQEMVLFESTSCSANVYLQNHLHCVYSTTPLRPWIKINGSIISSCTNGPAGLHAFSPPMNDYEWKHVLFWHWLRSWNCSSKWFQEQSKWFCLVGCNNGIILWLQPYL